MQIILTVVLVFSVTAIILGLSQYAKKNPFSFHRLEYINTQSKYQTLLMLVAMAVLTIIYLVNPTNFSIFFGFGIPNSPASGVALFGIADGQSWLTLGSSLTLFITLLTATFIYLQFRKVGKNYRQILPFAPYIVSFSLTNSFAEEVIYRLGVIVPLFGNTDPNIIMLISALAFGAPHLRGMPNGIVGAVMAGVLGWLLAKSVLETNGIFWAWSIHFLQDIVIYTAIVLSAIGKEARKTKIDRNLA